MRCPDHEPGEERHQQGRHTREPVGPYVIRYIRREWTHHRKVTSHRTSDPDLQNIVAYLRTLQKSPPRDGSDQRSGRSSERSLRVLLRHPHRRACVDRSPGTTYTRAIEDHLPFTVARVWMTPQGMPRHVRIRPLPIAHRSWHARSMAAIDRVVARISLTQHGTFHRHQAVDAGATPAQIQNRITSGEWSRLDRGVFALDSVGATWERQVMAAILSAGKAIATGPTAGALHRIPGCRPGRPEITIPSGADGRSRIATVRRRADFRSIERVRLDNIPSSSAAETLFDLARRFTDSELASAIDHVLVTRKVTTNALFLVLDRTAGSRLKGTVRFREAVRDLGAGYVPTESELERLLLSVVDDPSIPRPERQVRLDWWSTMPHRVDALIVAWRLILEADGRPFHTKRADFERDRRRDNLAVAHGYRVMRFTHRMLTREPQVVRDQIIAAGAPPQGF